MVVIDAPVHDLADRVREEHDLLLEDLRRAEEVADVAHPYHHIIV